MGEFVAVLQEALVCLAPVPPSFECVVYSREFPEIIHSVKVFGYCYWSRCLSEVCEERVAFGNKILFAWSLGVIPVFRSSGGWFCGWYFFCRVFVAYLSSLGEVFSVLGWARWCSGYCRLSCFRVDAFFVEDKVAFFASSCRW